MEIQRRKRTAMPGPSPPPLSSMGITDWRIATAENGGVARAAEMEGKATRAADANARSSAPVSNAPARRRRPDDTVDSLFRQGKRLYEQKKYQEAEEVWKSALQINQTDMRTQLYYAAMLRERGEVGDEEKADQLLGQTMGDWTEYTSIGMKEPASPTEMYRRPKLVSPKKDMAKLEFVRQSNRSKVHFYAMKTLKKKIADMEFSQSGEVGHEEDDEAEDEEGVSYEESSILPANLDDSEPSFDEPAQTSSSQEQT